MKKLIMWLAKVFKVDLVEEKIVYRTRIVTKQVALEGDVQGTVHIEGDLLVSGSITVTGEVAAITE